MNLDDMTPVGGGTLRGQAAPSTSKLAGTFSETRAVDPSEIWQPHSREVAPGDRPLSNPDPYARPGAASERPARWEHMGERGVFAVPGHTEVAQMTRAAVRP